VADPPEFFANGVLVHNCFRYHNRLMRVDNKNAPVAKVFRMGKGPRIGSARATEGHG
jgi:hypothetical protein